MAYSQYSKTAASVATEDDSTTAGSSSFSSWDNLLQSNNRKRALGRVKLTAMPQRMSFMTTACNEEDEENLTPKDVSEASKTIEAITKNPSTTTTRVNTSTRLNNSSRLNTSSRLTATSARLNIEPQRTLTAPRDVSFPMPQRAKPHARFGHASPVKSPFKPRPPTCSSIVTPEKPHLQTIKWTPKRRTDRDRSQSPRRPLGSVSTCRSQSTPPVMKRSQEPPRSLPEPPVVHQQVKQPKQPPVTVTVPSPAKLPKPQLRVNGKAYSLLERIGKGGSSEVFQALEAGGSRMRAIKRVDLSEVSHQEATAFRNEVALLKKLQGNRRIVKLIDYEERPRPDGRGQELFVVMEYGERDLSNMLKEVTASENGLTDAKTKFYWEEMLEAVATVHKEAVLHSDLKPANFLIVNGTLKLIDFGIASAVNDNKTHVTKDNLMGTFNFMSPEAIQDLNGVRGDDGKTTVKISFKSDVWSLGCILYNLVYKKLPFSDFRHPVAKFQAIIDSDHKIAFPRDRAALLDHDPLVVDVLESCLIRDPTKRASIEELMTHPYLRSANKQSNNPTRDRKPLAVDQLLSAISTLTPNSKAKVMENLNSLTVPQYPQQ